MFCTWLKKTKLEKTHNPPPKHFRNERVLAFAAGEIGVKEVPGKGDNPQVVKYHAYATVDNKQGMADSVPWCASFIAYCLEQVGMGSTNNKAARSYLKWGVSSAKDPLPGDIVVFWRGSKNGWQGHVGFLVEKKVNGQLYVLGGNQSDAVNIKMFTPYQVLDIRRSSKMHELNDEERERLHLMAKRILMGETISLADSLA